MRYLDLCLALVASSLFPVAVPAQEPRADPERAPRPDIVVILADDLGWSDIGCYGGEIQTPNLDRLAANGLRFTQFYNTGRCCPTRASLLTGLYPHQTGVGHMTGDRGHDGYRGDLNDRCLTIAEVLRTAGYATYMAGKWHVTKHVGRWSGAEQLTSTHGFPRQRGFDRFWGTISGGGNYFNPITLVRDDAPVAPQRDDFYYTDAISEHAARFVERHARRDERGGIRRPFFLYVAYTSPHWPLHAPDSDVKRYRGRYDGGWDALREERLARQLEMGLVDPKWKLTDRDPRVVAWEEAEHKTWQARRMEVYAAQVDRMDRGIGRIVDAIDRAGRKDDTLMLFLADNGGCAEEIRDTWTGLAIAKRTRDDRPVQLGNDPNVMPGPEQTFQSYGVPWANASNTPFRLYKHYVHEGGIATPLIAHWPGGIAAERRGELERQPGHLIDLMATFVEVAGAEYPDEVDGRAIAAMEGQSLAPAFIGGTIARPNSLYFEHEGNRAVRDGKWKLVARGARGRWELYDIEADRTETRDLIDERPELARRLAAKWDAWAERAQVLPWPYAPRPEKR